MLLELVDDSAELLLSCFQLSELAAAASTCQRLAGQVRDNSLWALVCKRLWHGKLVPQKFVNLLEAGEAREAYRLSLIDSRRTRLASRELTQFTWSFRFKATAGEAWTEDDPWWYGSAARSGHFRADGTFRIGPTRLRWKFARLSSEERHSLDVVAAKARGEVVAEGGRVDRTFGPRTIVASVHEREVPAYVVRRHAGTWGWIMESCWVLWTSWPMPLQGSRCPVSLELDDERLLVTVAAQEMQAVSFNMGIRGSGLGRGDFSEEEATSSGSSDADADYSIAGQQAPMAEVDGEDDEEDDDEADGDQEAAARQASQFVFLRAGPQLMRIPRAIFEAMTEEDLQAILADQNQANT